MRRGSANRQSAKATAAAANGRNQVSAAVAEVPPVESVVARLETLTKLLHECGQTRLPQVFMEIRVLADDLRKVGPYLEQAYPDALDRVMSSMRDASASSALPPSLRLAVFELVELRASKWCLPSDTSNYYRQRRILKDGSDETPDLGVGPDLDAVTGTIAQQVAQKAFRQEILIKNSDSGKVMGVRGRRISKIEKLSDTIVSFEKVDPLAKERVLSINGYTQQSINLAKQLIQETIARNSSPVFDGSPNASAAATPAHASQSVPLPIRQPQPLLPTPDIISGQHSTLRGENENGNLTLENLLTGLDNLLNNNNAGVGSAESGAPPLFNYTVNIGSQTLRVSGNNLSLVQEAKLTLDDYFAQKYPQMFYTMHVRTRSTSSEFDNNDDEELGQDPRSSDPLQYKYGHSHGGPERDQIAAAAAMQRELGLQASNRFSRTYERSVLLNLGEKSRKPPDFSHLDQITKDNIVLQKPRSIEEFKLGISKISK